jgi:threonyl-tRNA synthetase
MSRDEAVRFFEERGEPFKVEIIQGIDAPTVSLYKQGDFIDLCRGPHVASTGQIQNFKLLSSSGAYCGATRRIRCSSESTARRG